MPAYHSSYNDKKHKTLCGAALLPLHTSYKGPCPSSSSGQDALEEIFTCFKANVMFRNFEVKGGGDRLLIYMTLYISAALLRLGKSPDKASGEKALYTMAVENFKIPGDPGFPLTGIFSNPKDRKEADEFREMIKQLRQEAGKRLTARCYNADGSKSKWWFCFTRKKFLNKSL